MKWKGVDRRAWYIRPQQDLVIDLWMGSVRTQAAKELTTQGREMIVWVWYLVSVERAGAQEDDAAIRRR